MSHAKAPPFFYRLSHGIRITVRPEYLAGQSDAARQRFVFAYHVRIENVGTQPARLVARHWKIHDSIGEDIDIEGEGVVGEQPLIAPGAVHEYESFCILKSPGGHMEGEYRFIRSDRTTFDAEIPRFILTLHDAEAG